jgi:hypothetical protein
MRNGEVKEYRGCQIRKHTGTKYTVGGCMRIFTSYAAAKDEIDAWIKEDEALREANEYVREHFGGWL